MRNMAGTEGNGRRYARRISDNPAIRNKGLRLLAGSLPAAVAVAWLPLRAHLPDTDLALVLVVVIAGVGFAAGRLPYAFGAWGAGLSFDLLHTPPYGELAIRSGKDVVTTAFLVVAGLIMGEVALRLGRYRRRAEAEAEAFALVADTAGLVATGSEVGLVIEALSAELASGLQLRDCTFHAGPPTGDVPFVGRNGETVRLDGLPSAEPGALDLPVWSSGEIVGRFRMALSSAAALEAAQLQLAIAIADQAGTALAPQRFGTVPADRGRRGLRLVKD
jgi:hypothetical protein